MVLPDEPDRGALIARQPAYPHAVTRNCTRHLPSHGFSLYRTRIPALLKTLKPPRTRRLDQLSTLETSRPYMGYYERVCWAGHSPYNIRPETSKPEALMTG